MSRRVRNSQAPKMHRAWPAEKVQAMQELRRSNAGGFHDNKAKYSRKTKYKTFD